MVKKILFLFTFLFISILNVNAREIGSFTLSKSGTLTSDYLTLYQGSGNFANWGQGTLIYTFGYTTNDTGSLNLPVLTSAYADSGGKSYVCEFGSVAITSPSTSTNATTGVSYTIACPMNMAANGLTNLGLIFSSQFNSAYSFNYSTSYSVEFITEDTFSSFDIVNAIAQNAYYTQQVIISESNDLSNILNSLNQNIQNTITNQNQNTQDIIDNQNQNTQQEIESQKVCKDTSISYEQATLNKGKFLLSNGALSGGTSTGWGITDYISINSDSTVTISNVYINTACHAFYTNDKTFISSICTNGTFNAPTNASFIRFSIRYLNNTQQPLITLHNCANGNQALSDDINNLNDTLNSEQNPNTNQDINDMNNMVASDTPISDLITMPLTLINAYINGLDASCSSINLGSLLGTNLSIPCINIQQYFGSDLWNTIDVLCCIFLCYEIAMLFISAFDGITSLRDDFEGLYQPRHAYTGYKPKHGGDN